jgi:circadian clock protein KaiC
MPQTTIPAEALLKTPSGIAGLDEIMDGGLPAGRPTLMCGGAGCGKTLFGLTFLVEGALHHGEPGVLMCFEETEAELSRNMASLGYDLPGLVAAGRLAIDYVRIERSEIEETGAYDLDGLFVRLDYAIRSVGARRVVLDTLEVLFSGMSDTAALRAELRRLFRWLKDRGMTAIITAERGEGALTRHGLEEYVSDCVILLDHRVVDQMATRRIRVVKYRGSAHGTSEYPFLIGTRGIAVLPVTSLQLTHEASEERITTGIPDLDNMLGGEGYYRGSSVLVSGTSGTGKTTIAAQFADATCRQGGRALFFAFEESPHQLLRNMRKVGINLSHWVDEGSLQITALRPTLCGLEMHLVRMHDDIESFKPSVVVLDPIYNLKSVGSAAEVHAMLLRLIDFLKGRGVTALFTAIDSQGMHDAGQEGVSSLMDTWIQVRAIEHSGERNRGIFVLKSRGMNHSNQIREFILSDRGIQLRDVYLGLGGVLSGAARIAQEALEAATETERLQMIALNRREVERRRRALQAQIASLQTELEAQDDEHELFAARQRSAAEVLIRAHAEVAATRNRGRAL